MDIPIAKVVPYGSTFLPGSVTAHTVKTRRNVKNISSPNAWTGFKPIAALTALTPKLPRNAAGVKPYPKPEPATAEENNQICD